MAEPKIRHDAKWTPAVIEYIAGVLAGIQDESKTVLVDPMAGGGFGVVDAFIDAGVSIESLWGIEIEKEWAAAEDWIGHGNALHVDDYPLSPCRIFTSIDYGNRMSGNFLGSPCRECKGRSKAWKRKQCPVCRNSGSDAGRRKGYAISLGRELSPANMARNGWGSDWRTKKVELFHLWATKLDLPIDRALILNIKDHYRSRRVTIPATGVRESIQELVPVSDWCIEVLVGMGFELVERKRIRTPSYSEGQNREAREASEQVLTFDFHGGRP